MLLKFYPYFIAILYAFIANTVATITKQPSAGEITHISSNITIFDKKILQLQVNWNDTLPKDTRYNVILSALNETDCPDFPCSAYGIPKPTEYILIPDNPMTYVENMECNYMPGCNYSLRIETSTTKVSKTQPFSIPYCVEHICSCQHAATLPSVAANLNVTSNRTLDIIWHIDTHQLQSFAMNRALSGSEFNLSSIYMKLNKQTNPSLSWGGKHIPIAENFYPLQNISRILKSKDDKLKGIIRIEMNEALAPKTVLFLRVHVMDTLRCAGPEKIIKIEVPAPSLPFIALINNDIDLRIGLIIVTTLFVLAVAAALAILIWKRQKAKNHIDHINKDEQYFAPLAGVIEMEDNINYVDKYIEDAQLKGLADVFEIPHHAIRLGPEIGEGAFGRVYKATANNIRRMRGTMVVAVKQLKKNPTADEVAEFLSEIEMLKGVGTHHNIVSFLGCCTIRSPYLMVMEYVGRGDLLSYLRTVRQEKSKFKPLDANCACGTTVADLQKQEQQKLTTIPVSYIELKVSEESIYDEAEEERRPKPSFAETTYTIIDGDDPYGVENFEPFQYILNHRELHNFALQIANGMRFLEEQEITHRDLAARNVLISDFKTLKISDFGLSRHGIYTNTKTRKLPLRWLSIEAIRDNLYSNKSDVWAYGVVLWEIGTLGASPYPTVSNSELIPMLLSGKRLEKPEICTDEVYRIMEECWLEDPDERPTFEQLYKMLSPKTTYVDINSLSDDYVFPPIKEKIS